MKFKDELGSALVDTKGKMLLIAYTSKISQECLSFMTDNVMSKIESFGQSDWAVLFKSVGQCPLHEDLESHFVNILSICFANGCRCDAYVLHSLAGLAQMGRLREKCHITIPIEEVDFDTSEQAQAYLLDYLAVLETE